MRRRGPGCARRYARCSIGPRDDDTNGQGDRCDDGHAGVRGDREPEPGRPDVRRGDLARGPERGPRPDRLVAQRRPAGHGHDGGSGDRSRARASRHHVRAGRARSGHGLRRAAAAARGRGRAQQRARRALPAVGPRSGRRSARGGRQRRAAHARGPRGVGRPPRPPSARAPPPVDADPGAPHRVVAPLRRPRAHRGRDAQRERERDAARDLAAAARGHALRPLVPAAP